MQSQNLNGQWELRHEALAAIGMDGLKSVSETKTDWIPATVPGEVHLDLMAAGLMEEPLFSDNWFDLPPGLPRTIVCHGANPDAVRFMYAGPNGWAGLGSGRNADGKPVYDNTHGRRRRRHGGDPQ